MRYHECRQESAPIEWRIDNPVTPGDFELKRMCEVNGPRTPASLTMRDMAVGATSCLGLTVEQTEVFVLSSVLVFGLCRREHAWQSFTILVGPPGGGKSESVNTVANCLIYR